MTILLILGAGIAAFAIFIAGCFVGHRTGRNEGSDSALRWCAHYESSKYGDAGVVNPPMENETWYYVGGGRFAVRPDTKPKGPETVLTGSSVRKPVDDAQLRKMAAAHMERVMTKEGWDL